MLKPERLPDLIHQLELGIRHDRLKSRGAIPVAAKPSRPLIFRTRSVTAGGAQSWSSVLRYPARRN